MKHLLAYWTRIPAYGLLAWLLVSLPPFLSAAQAGELHAAIIPNEVGRLEFRPGEDSELRFFATIINDTDIDAQLCRIALSNQLPFTLRFWATDPNTNQIIGEQDQPVDIASRGSQSFVFTLELQSGEYIPEQRLAFTFDCETHQGATQVAGVNDLSLSAGTPRVLLALATPDEENRVVLNNQIQGQPCSAILHRLAEPSPCGAGVMALAMVNTSPAPLNLIVSIDGGIGDESLLCRTNSSGDCLDTSRANPGLELSLEPNEIATFSAFLLSFNDGSFDFNSSAPTTGFIVREFDPEDPFFRRSVAQVTTAVMTGPFEWSAVRSAGQLAVSGAISVNGCSMGTLEVQMDSQPNPGELHLTVGEASRFTDPLTACPAVIFRDRVFWTSEGPIEDIERVIVTKQTPIPELEESITLRVENAPL